MKTFTRPLRGRIAARTRTVATLCALLLGLQALPATAQEVTLKQMIDALAIEGAGTRGIGRDDPAEAMSATGDPRVARLLVGFQGDTPFLTLDGMKTLRTLATALDDPRLADARIRILGHSYIADAPTTSEPVSSRRAQVVMEHLATFYRVDPARMQASGVGAAQVNTQNLADPLNQRIEIINLGML